MSRRWPTRRARGAHRDAGMSLTELLITMLVMSIIVIASATLSIGFQRTNASNVVRQDQIDAARTASEAMSKTIRAAVKPSQLTTTACGGCTQDAFIKAGDFVVQFYANINNPGNIIGPSRVTYSVASSGADAGKLIQSIQRPDSNTPGATGYQYCDAAAGGASAACKARLSTIVLARGMVTTSTPLFSYYNNDATASHMDPPAGGSLTAAEMEKVLSMELAVKVQTNAASRAEPTTYIQRIMLPNSQAVIRQGEESP